MELFALLNAIQKRPAMYLGHPDLARLDSFLAGYFFARRQLGIPETEQEQKFSDFQTWIQQKFKVDSSQSWDLIIQASCPDGKTALDQFFHLFNEFSKLNQLSSSSLQRPLAS